MGDKIIDIHNLLENISYLVQESIENIKIKDNIVIQVPFNKF